jgi:hypothetical protein
MPRKQFLPDKSGVSASMSDDPVQYERSRIGSFRGQIDLMYDATYQELRIHLAKSGMLFRT